MLNSISALFSSIKKTPSSYNLPYGFTFTAHTGCEGMPDNSLDSIRAGATAGADIVEIDLHFLSDGTPVLKHDAPKASEADTLPRLDSAFELLSSLDIKMNVDVKSTNNLAEVVVLAQKWQVTDKIFFTGIREEDIAAVKKYAPSVPYYLNVNVDKRQSTNPAYIKTLIDKVRTNGAVGLNANFRSCSKELIEAFRAEGIPVSLWTANKKSHMRRCLALAPDNITTRKPSVLREIIR